VTKQKGSRQCFSTQLKCEQRLNHEKEGTGNGRAKKKGGKLGKNERSEAFPLSCWRGEGETLNGTGKGFGEPTAGRDRLKGLEREGKKNGDCNVRKRKGGERNKRSKREHRGKPK